MGKAKRFNDYDGAVQSKRREIQGYGQTRQGLSGITSTFRNSPLAPVAVSAAAATVSSGGGSASFPLDYSVDAQGNKGGVTVTHDLNAVTAHKLSFTATGAVTIAFSNYPTSGTGIDWYVEITQDGTGGHAITWPSEVTPAPNPTTTADTTSLIALHTDDAGTTVRAIALLNAAPTAGNFATKALDNLSSPVVNTELSMGTNKITNVVDPTSNQDAATKKYVDDNDVAPSGLATTELDNLGTTAVNAQINMGANSITCDNNVFGINFRNNADDDYIGFFLDTVDDMVIDDANNFKIRNTITGASGTANFVSYRNDATSSAGDELGSIRFEGNNDAGTPETIQYVRFLAGIADETDGSEDGQALLQVAEAGSLVSYVSLNLTNSGTVGFLKDVDMNAKKIDLDLDNDTSIRADTDDEVQFEVGGLDVLKIVAAGGLNWNLAGVGHSISAGSTTLEISLGAVTDSYVLDFDANNKHTFTDGGVSITSNGAGNLGYFFESIFSPTTPADDDVLALYQWNGKNDAGSPVVEPYAQMQVIQTDVTSTSEDAAILFSCMSGGVLTDMLRIDSRVSLETNINLNLAGNDIENIGVFDMNVTPTVTGSTGGNAALQDLLVELEALGLIVDSST